MQPVKPKSTVLSSSGSRTRGRRRRRQFIWLAYPLKLASVASIGALCAWLMFLFCAKALHPYLLGYSGDREIATMRSRLALQTRRNEALEKRVTYLQTPEGIESEVRHNGFHKAGEHVYLLPTDQNPVSSSGN